METKQNEFTISLKFQSSNYLLNGGGGDPNGGGWIFKKQDNIYHESFVMSLGF